MATTDGWRPQEAKAKDVMAVEGARVETTGVEVMLVNLPLCGYLFFSPDEEEGKVTEGQSRNLNMSRGRRLKRTNDFVDDGFAGATQQFRFSTLDDFIKCLI